MASMATYLERLMKQLKEFEGSMPWMYRDKDGGVRVGVGMMLPEAAATESMPFQVEGRAASSAEVAAEFERVHALEAGHAASFYRSETSPLLAEDAIEERLLRMLTGFEADLRARVPGYDEMPEGPKLALLDMIYDLGPHGLFRGYPHMLKAVEARAWAIAAAASPRRGASTARNQWTRARMLSAVTSRSMEQPAGRLTGIKRVWRRLRP